MLVINSSGAVSERIELGGSPECSNLALSADGRLAVTDVTAGRVLVSDWSPSEET
jgi:hypothetical protein